MDNLPPAAEQSSNELGGTEASAEVGEGSPVDGDAEGTAEGEGGEEAAGGEGEGDAADGDQKSNASEKGNETFHDPLADLPEEFNTGESTKEGMRVLQCIEWLRDRIVDGKLGDEETEMVTIPSPCV